MRKTILRIIALFMGLLAALVLIPQLILSFPNLYLPHRHTYKNYRIFSDKELDPTLNPKLDSMANRLSVTGFYASTKPIKVVMAYDPQWVSFLERLTPAPSGATGFHHFSGVLYIFPGRIAQYREQTLNSPAELLACVQYTHQRYEWDFILAHEILHLMHSDTMGFWKFKRELPPPHWKAEGFAEYYTFQWDKQRDSTYDFRREVTLYLRYHEQFPLEYKKYQLMYEFLTEYEGLSFAEIMEEEMGEEVVFERLDTWYENN